MSEFAVDLIEELKLRRWARLNYRRLEEWDASLDPIVLHELRTIQREAKQQTDRLSAEQQSLPISQPAPETFGSGIELRNSA